MLHKLISKRGENDLFAIIIGLFTVAMLGLIVLLVNSNTIPVMQKVAGNGTLAYQALEKAGG